MVYLYTGKLQVRIWTENRYSTWWKHL